MTNKELVPNYNLYLYLVNDTKLIKGMNKLVQEWVETHRNETHLDLRLRNSVRLGIADYHNGSDSPEDIKAWMLKSEFLTQYVSALKTLLIDRLYRNEGKIHLVYEARLFELSTDVNTISLFYPRLVRPHTAIVLRKVHEGSYIEACYVVTLNNLDYSLGIYGTKARQSFLDRVTIYSN